MSQNDPFVDCYKRTAFAVIYTFLAINGRRHNIDPGPTFACIAGLHGRGMFSFQPLVDWRRQNVSPE